MSLALAVSRSELVRGLALIAPLTQPPPGVPRLLAPMSRLPFPVRLALAGTVVDESIHGSSFRYSRISPGWQSRTRQISSRVEKRMALAF